MRWPESLQTRPGILWRNRGTRVCFYGLATAPRGTKPIARGAGDFFRENLQTAGFFVAFPGTSPRPGRDIPERRQPEAIPDQGGFASRLTGTGVVGTRGGSGVLSGE